MGAHRRRINRQRAQRALRRIDFQQAAHTRTEFWRRAMLEIGEVFAGFGSLGNVQLTVTWS